MVKISKEFKKRLKMGAIFIPILFVILTALFKYIKPDNKSGEKQEPNTWKNAMLKSLAMSMIATFIIILGPPYGMIMM